MLDVGCWMWDVGCWMFDVGCWMWDVGCWMWDVGCWMWDVGCGFSWSPQNAPFGTLALPCPRTPETRFSLQRGAIFLQKHGFRMGGVHFSVLGVSWSPQKRPFRYPRPALPQNTRNKVFASEGCNVPSKAWFSHGGGAFFSVLGVSWSPPKRPFRYPCPALPQNARNKVSASEGCNFTSKHFAAVWHRARLSVNWDAPRLLQVSRSWSSRRFRGRFAMARKPRPMPVPSWLPDPDTQEDVVNIHLVVARMDAASWGLASASFSAPSRNGRGNVGCSRTWRPGGDVGRPNSLRDALCARRLRNVLK
jgi:hypothetical protein